MNNLFRTSRRIIWGTISSIFFVGGGLATIVKVSPEAEKVVKENPVANELLQQTQHFENTASHFVENALNSLTNTKPNQDQISYVANPIGLSGYEPEGTTNKNSVSQISDLPSSLELTSQSPTSKSTQEVEPMSINTPEIKNQKEDLNANKQEVLRSQNINEQDETSKRNEPSSINNNPGNGDTTEKNNLPDTIEKTETNNEENSGEIMNSGTQSSASTPRVSNVESLNPQINNLNQNPSGTGDPSTSIPQDPNLLSQGNARDKDGTSNPNNPIIEEPGKEKSGEGPNTEPNKPSSEPIRETNSNPSSSQNQNNEGPSTLENQDVLGNNPTEPSSLTEQGTTNNNQGESSPEPTHQNTPIETSGTQENAEILNEISGTTESKKKNSEPTETEETRNRRKQNAQISKLNYYVGQFEIEYSSSQQPNSINNFSPNYHNDIIWNKDSVPIIYPQKETENPISSNTKTTRENTDLPSSSPSSSTQIIEPLSGETNERENPVSPNNQNTWTPENIGNQEIVFVGATTVDSNRRWFSVHYFIDEGYRFQNSESESTTERNPIITQNFEFEKPVFVSVVEPTDETISIEDRVTKITFTTVKNEKKYQIIFEFIHKEKTRKKNPNRLYFTSNDPDSQIFGGVNKLIIKRALNAVNPGDEEWETTHEKIITEFENKASNKTEIIKELKKPKAWLTEAEEVRQWYQNFFREDAEDWTEIEQNIEPTTDLESSTTSFKWKHLSEEEDGKGLTKISYVVITNSKLYKLELRPHSNKSKKNKGVYKIKIFVKNGVNWDVAPQRTHEFLLIDSGEDNAPIDLEASKQKVLKRLSKIANWETEVTT